MSSGSRENPNSPDAAISVRLRRAGAGPSGRPGWRRSRPRPRCPARRAGTRSRRERAVPHHVLDEQAEEEEHREHRRRCEQHRHEAGWRGCGSDEHAKGSSGCFTRDSMTAGRLARSSAPATRETIVQGSPQPWSASPARVRPNTMPSRPRGAGDGARVSRAVRGATRTPPEGGARWQRPSSPIGTLIRKVSRQPLYKLEPKNAVRGRSASHRGSGRLPRRNLDIAA